MRFTGVGLVPNPIGVIIKRDIWTQACIYGEHYVKMKAEIRVMLL